MRRNLWKKVTSATLCAAMVGGIMVSNGALAVQAEEGEEKEVILSESWEKQEWTAFPQTMQ